MEYAGTNKPPDGKRRTLNRVIISSPLISVTLCLCGNLSLRRFFLFVRVITLARLDQRNIDRVVRQHRPFA